MSFRLNVLAIDQPFDGRSSQFGTVLFRCYLSQTRPSCKAQSKSQAQIDSFELSEDTALMSIASTDKITGRCYCGSITFRSASKPLTVAYCHCEDCRRATGGPVAAFAAFDDDAITFEPNEGKNVTVNPGVTRSFCDNCGSSLAGRYEYLPNQIYISIGVIDQAADLAPVVHAHEANRLTWLHIVDDLERLDATATTKLNAT
ncbi:GFA family protein [Yoonia sp. R2-816]|uniref:GFA family protein n=1 Tax=Yoonia sp. R2-816 TaxID=3342638 RepID=UPI0037298CD2